MSNRVVLKLILNNLYSDVALFKISLFENRIIARLVFVALLFFAGNGGALGQEQVYTCSPILKDVFAGKDIIININCDLNDDANQEELGKCLDSSHEVEASCTAYKKSGFHSSPSANCSISLLAPSGYFFPHKSVFVKEEAYRNISGLPAKLALKPKLLAESDERLIGSFEGSIGCTNAAGTGRTCESRATVIGVAYPLNCSAYISELQELI